MIDLISLMTRVDDARLDSKYRLVLVAAQRARQLMRGAKPHGTIRFAKETTTALREVLHSEVEYLTGKDARSAMKEVRSLREPEPRPRLFPVAVADDTNEIKKDLTNYVNDTKPEPAPPAEDEA